MFQPRLQATRFTKTVDYAKKVEINYSLSKRCLGGISEMSGTNGVDSQYC